MTNEQILRKAIEKVIRNGWELGNEWPRFEIILAGVAFFDSKAKCYAHDLNSGNVYSIEEIIFSHDFAKAFWGIKPGFCQNCASGLNETAKEHEKNTIPEWQYHLQQMVLEKNPIKYLGKFLKN